MRGAEAAAFENAVPEPEWQVTINLPELPRLLLQERDGGGSWLNYHTRLMVDEMAVPAPRSYHDASDQIVSTIAYAAGADVGAGGGPNPGGSTDAEPETGEESGEETEVRESPPDIPEQTEQEGLDAWA